MTEAAEITLYNTATRAKERFQPLDRANVRMYVCGPTVYDRAHIGNARPVVVFDVLFRLLRHLAPKKGWGKVTYVRNITDVDDKINARAVAEKRPIREITDETAGWYLADMAALGALPPTHEPRATEYVPEMVAMIETLIARGNAYAAEGHVLFSVGSFPAYGRFANRSLDEMQAGARVEVAPYKRDPMDFVLWKPSSSAEPGWPSPWGHGRPGWHIECSAMSAALLGASFDIHGGGIDLVFPHHENEIAQSACAHPEGKFARYWLHNGFLNVEGEKMSKSLGNFFTVREVLDGSAGLYGGKQSGEEIRMALMLSHYREPMDYGVARRHEARATVADFAQRLGRGGSEALHNLTPGEPLPEVVAALRDDLNTPLAVALLRRRALIDRYGPVGVRERLDSIYASQVLLGFDLRASVLARDASRRTDEGREVVRRAIEEVGWAEQDSFNLRIAGLLREREKARASRDFRRADAIRDALTAAGIKVMDRAGGASEWELGPDFDPAKLDGIEA